MVIRRPKHWAVEETLIIKVKRELIVSADGKLVLGLQSSLFSAQRFRNRSVTGGRRPLCVQTQTRRCPWDQSAPTAKGRKEVIAYIIDV